jgi:hypothetical protein
MLVNVLYNAVKAVINYRHALGKNMVLPDLVIKVAAGRPEGRVIHDAGCSAQGRGACAGIKIIAGNGDARVKAEVGVNVNPAGYNDFSGGIDTLHICPAAAGEQIFPNLRDFSPFAEHIAYHFRGFGNHKAILYKEFFHTFTAVYRKYTISAARDKGHSQKTAKNSIITKSACSK